MDREDVTTYVAVVFRNLLRLPLSRDIEISDCLSGESHIRIGLKRPSPRTMNAAYAGGTFVFLARLKRVCCPKQSVYRL